MGLLGAGHESIYGSKGWVIRSQQFATPARASGTQRQFYFAYRRLKNLACVEVHPQANTILVYTKVDPKTVELVDGFTRDVSKVGHYGTGDLEVRITDDAQLSQAEPLIAMSYANS